MNSEFFIITGFVAGSILLSFGLVWFMRKWQLDGMRRVASELGYEFQSGGATITDSAAFGASSPEAVSILTKIVSFLAPWKIRGDDSGHSLSIYTITRGSGRSRSTYTVVEMGVSPRETQNFHISREGILSKIGKALGGQDIQTDDPEFDPKVRVKGGDADALRRLLSDPGLRGAILSALEAYPALEISGTSIKFERSGIITKTDFYRALIPTMSALVTKFS